MKKREITLEELEAFINDFRATFSHVDMAVEINFVNDDTDLDFCFNEAKAELESYFNQSKIGE